MIFNFLSLFFLFIFIFAEDTEQKRLEKEAKEWKKIMGSDYDV